MSSIVTFPKKYQNAPMRNERGFTIAEMLIAFMVFCILVSLFPLAIQNVGSLTYLEQRTQKLEWEVFLSQIKKETRLSNPITVLGDKLLLQKNGETILYEKYGSNLRRRVNYTGHETLLQNVASVRFVKANGGYDIYVYDLDDIEYSAKIRSFISVEVK